MKIGDIGYFILGLVSILLFSFKTTNTELFKPVKPSSVVVDCFVDDLDDVRNKIKSISNSRSVDNYILKDMEITRDGFSHSVCLYFERY